jgi:hypothetical protein
MAFVPGARSTSALAGTGRIISGVVCWFGFVLTTVATNNAYPGRKTMPTVIDAGHWLGAGDHRRDPRRLGRVKARLQPKSGVCRLVARPRYRIMHDEKAAILR